VSDEFQKSVANWSNRIVRDLTPSPALLKSSDTISIPQPSDALDPGQAYALPFWPFGIPIRAAFPSPRFGAWRTVENFCEIPATSYDVVSADRNGQPDLHHVIRHDRPPCGMSDSENISAGWVGQGLTSVQVSVQLSCSSFSRLRRCWGMADLSLRQMLPSLSQPANRTCSSVDQTPCPL